jgi:predicted peptidase
MHIAYWKPKATNTDAEYVTLIAFPLQQWLHEGGSVLHVHCPVLWAGSRNEREKKNIKK